MAIITDTVSLILYDITSFKSVCKSGSIAPFCVCEKSKTRLKDSHRANLALIGILTQQSFPESIDIKAPFQAIGMQR